MAKVSIIIPVYNSEKYLERCLNTILNQTYTDFEIILIDDDSKDRSYNIIKDFQHSNKIKLIKNEQNIGPGGSRNRGLEIASGEYIMFIDSDDYIEPRAIEKMYYSCVENEVDIARINRLMVFKNINMSFLGRNTNIKANKIVFPKTDLDFLSDEPPCATNKMFRKELIGTSKFPENLKWEDYPFVIPLLYKADKVAVISDNDAYYKYNINLSGTTISDTRKVSTKLLDIFICSDIVKDSLLTQNESTELEKRVNLIATVNCLQRIRDVLYSNMSFKRKKELISLISELVNKKYGIWEEDSLYQEYRQKNKLYDARMQLIEKLFIEDYTSFTEHELENKINKILVTTYKQ